jgi:hypothetical protein
MKYDKRDGVCSTHVGKCEIQKPFGCKTEDSHFTKYGIATGYGLNDRRVEVRVLVGSRIYEEYILK